SLSFYVSEVWHLIKNLECTQAGSEEVQNINHANPPRMHGRPPHCSGLTVIRSMISLILCLRKDRSGMPANGFVILPVAFEPYALLAFPGRPPLAPLVRAALAFASDLASRLAGPARTSRPCCQKCRLLIRRH